MAKIIDGQRRMVKLSVDDVLSVVKGYQQISNKSCCYEHTRELLNQFPIYLPEEV